MRHFSLVYFPSEHYSLNRSTSSMRSGYAGSTSSSLRLEVNNFNSFQYSYDFTLRFDILNIFQ